MREAPEDREHRQRRDDRKRRRGTFDDDAVPYLACGERRHDRDHSAELADEVARCEGLFMILGSSEGDRIILAPNNNCRNLFSQFVRCLHVETSLQVNVGKFESEVARNERERVAYLPLHLHIRKPSNSSLCCRRQLKRAQHCMYRLDCRAFVPWFIF